MYIYNIYKWLEGPPKQRGLAPLGDWHNGIRMYRDKNQRLCTQINGAKISQIKRTVQPVRHPGCFTDQNTCEKFDLEDVTSDSENLRFTSKFKENHIPGIFCVQKQTAAEQEKLEFD